MSRNGSGTYSKVNTFVAGNSVTAAGHNQNWDDLVAEMTNSVAADGQTPITAGLKGANGTAALPSYSFNSDLNTGVYRHGADELGFSVGGLLAGWFDSAKKFWMLGDADIAGNASITGTLGVTGAVTVPAKSFAISKFADTTANRLFGTDNSGVWTVVTLGNGVSLAAGSLTGTAQLPRGYIDGLTLSNGTDATNDINIAAGTCRDSTNGFDIVIATALGKQLDANWTPGGTTGTTVGGRDTAAGITNSTYHLYAVRTAASSAGDIYMTTAATAAAAITALNLEVANGGASYLYARHIGSIVRAGATILGFTQDQDTFFLSSPVLDIDVSNPGTSAVTRTMASCPTGIVMPVLFNAVVNGVTSGSITCYFSALASTDLAASATASPLGQISTANAAAAALSDAAQLRILTNTSAQIRSRFNVSGAGDLLKMATVGWVHPRGRNG